MHIHLLRFCGHSTVEEETNNGETKAIIGSCCMTTRCKISAHMYQQDKVVPICRRLVQPICTQEQEQRKPGGREDCGLKATTTLGCGGESHSNSHKGGCEAGAQR